MHLEFDLCLASGGAKGLVHIGAIKQLEKAGAKINNISGTSIGALIGGLYAYTKDIKAIEKVALEITKVSWYWTALKDFKGFGQGVLTGNHVMRLFEHIVPAGAKIEDCKIPFKCVAADLITGKRLVFSSGNLLFAIRASISLPITFEPVHLWEHVLVDGTCLDPAPVNVFFHRAPLLMVATCRSNGLYNTNIKNKAGILHTYMLNSTNALIRKSAEKTDATLWPEVDDIDTLEFWKAKQAIKEGERLVRKFINN